MILDTVTISFFVHSLHSKRKKIEMGYLAESECYATTAAGATSYPIRAKPRRESLGQEGMHLTRG